MRQIIFFLIHIAIGSCCIATLHAQETLRKPDDRNVTYEEKGDWKSWSDGRIKFRFPRHWIVAIDSESTLEVPIVVSDEVAPVEWTYRLIDGERVALTILVIHGGPEFIECFCAPRDQYVYTEKGGVKIWTLSMNRGKLQARKMATEEMRMDIHQKMPKRKASRLLYIMSSIELQDPVDAK